MVVGAKVCDLTEHLLWFVCGNFDVSPKCDLYICIIERFCKLHNY